MINKKNTDSANNWQEFALLSLVISLAAIAIAGVALKIPFSEATQDVAYNQMITIAGLIIGTLGVGATVYFVIMGININSYNKRFEVMDKEFREMKCSLDKNMEMQYNESLDVMSSLEAISDVEQNIVTIRLAMGNFICKSDIHTHKYPLEEGIANLGLYSRSQKDIDTLQKIADNTDNKKIENLAKRAIENIQRKRIKAQAESELSRTNNLKWWRNKLGYIQL